MASRDEHGLHKVSSDGGLSNLAALDGALFARASSFVAATVSLRDLGFDRFVGIHLTEWSSDGLLTRSEDVVDLSAVVPASCRSASGLPCNLQASFRRDGDSIVVTVTGVDQLHRTRFDLTSWEQEPLPPIALEDRRAGEPVSEAATEGGSELALVGGSAPMMPPRPVIAVPGPGSASIMVPGVVSDPPAIARVLEGELVGWRFVTDSERASNSAIIGWRTIGDSLLPAWRVRTAMGFPPSALEVFADGGTTPTLLWTSADPSDAEASNLHVMRIRDDVSTCDWLTAATGAHFSWPLREIVARPFAASMADDVVIAAVVGESSGYPLVLLEVSCE
jgi:hypothetical protein